MSDTYRLVASRQNLNPVTGEPFSVMEARIPINANHRVIKCTMLDEDNELPSLTQSQRSLITRRSRYKNNLQMHNTNGYS